MLTARWRKVFTATTRVCFQEAEEQGAKGAPVPPWAPLLLAPARAQCPPVGHLASLTGTALTSASAALTAAPTRVQEVRIHLAGLTLSDSLFYAQGPRPHPEPQHPGTAMMPPPAPSQSGHAQSRPRPRHSTVRQEAAEDEICHNIKYC